MAFEFKKQKKCAFVKHHFNAKFLNSYCLAWACSYDKSHAIGEFTCLNKQLLEAQKHCLDLDLNGLLTWRNFGHIPEFSKIAKMALFYPCMKIKIFLGQMPLFEVLRKCHLVTLFKICLRLRPCAYLCG